MRELKERELSAKRKREDQEKKREERERKRDQEKSKEEKSRRDTRAKVSTTQRVSFGFQLRALGFPAKVEELLKRRGEAGEEARQRAEAAARLRKLILKEVTTKVWIF